MFIGKVYTNYFHRRQHVDRDYYSLHCIITDDTWCVNDTHNGTSGFQFRIKLNPLKVVMGYFKLFPPSLLQSESRGRRQESFLTETFDIKVTNITLNSRRIVRQWSYSVGTITTCIISLRQETSIKSLTYSWGRVMLYKHWKAWNKSITQRYQSKSKIGQ